MLAGGESNVRRSMPKSDSARGKVELMSRSCSRSLSIGDHRWTESGRKTTTIPANPASVTATCAAMPRASLGCIATIKGEHGQEIKAQIHALIIWEIRALLVTHPAVGPPHAGQLLCR